MAIVVTTLGVASDKASTDPWTAFSSVVLSTGDCLFLIVACDVVAPGSFKWNGIELDLNANVFSIGNVRTMILSLPGVTGATSDVVIDWTASQVPVAAAATLYKATNIAFIVPLDTIATAKGTGTAASSGATATLDQDNELIIGAIGVEDEIDDQTGSWTTGASNVSGNEQETGTNGGGDASNISIYSAAEVVAATTAQNADNTGMDSIDWAAAVATYREGAGGIGVLRRRREGA